MGSLPWNRLFFCVFFFTGAAGASALPISNLRVMFFSGSPCISFTHLRIFRMPSSGFWFTHWLVSRKYSIDFVSSTSSSLYTIIGIPLLAACSTSRSTCGERFAAFDINKTMMSERSIPSISSSAYSFPDRISRGAIKHWCPPFSSSSHMFCARAASLEECDINTYIIPAFPPQTIT